MNIKDKLQAARAVAAGWLPDVLMVAGAGAVSAGAGMVYVPAGWIVGGVFALVAGWLTARGGK
ncbi:MAG: hypothetical protein V4451_16070 [Pseudomonadota bacterium]